MKRFYIGLGGILSGIPGLATLIEALPVPPEWRLLFASLSGIFALLGLALVFVSKGKLKRLAKGNVVVRAIVFAVIGLLFGLLYVGIAPHCVVKHPRRGTAYYPLYITGGDIDVMVKRQGGRQAAIGQYGIDAVRDAVANMPNGSVWIGITTALLLTLYIGFHGSIVIALGIAWAGSAEGEPH